MSIQSASAVYSKHGTCSAAEGEERNRAKNRMRMRIYNKFEAKRYKRSNIFLRFPSGKETAWEWMYFKWRINSGLGMVERMLLITAGFR